MPGIIEQLGWDNINCGRVGGELFGLTEGRDLAASYGFAYRLDLAEKYNLDMDSVKTLEDLHDVLVTIKENEENCWPVAVSAGENIRNWVGTLWATRWLTSVFSPTWLRTPPL